MPGSAFDPSGFGRRAAAIVAGTVLAAGAAGVGWWQAHLSTSASCQITSPAAGTVVGPVTLSATCGSTATQVSFNVGGGQVASASTLPFSASWNSALIADGSYSLTAVATDANGNTVTSSPVSITTSNGTSGGGGTSTTAHVWVSAAGNDATCVRNASAVSYATALAASPTNVCATGPKAYIKSNLTDTVLVEGSPMTVTSQWLFAKANSKTATVGTCNYGYAGISSAQDLSNCVTIEPAAGQSLAFSIPNHAGNSFAPGGSAIEVCVDFLALENFTINQTTYVDNVLPVGDTDSDYGLVVGNADSTCNPNSDQPHDILIQNVIAGGGLDQGGGSYNTWFVSDTYRDVLNQAPNFTAEYPCPGGVVTHNAGIINSTYLDTTFTFNDPAHHHGAIQHFTNTCSDSQTTRFNHIVFAGNTLAGTCLPSSSSCPEGLEVETSFDHLLLENNFFDNGQVNDLECVSSGCNMISNTVRFNSFADGSYFQARQVCTTSCSGSIDANVAYGNVNAACQTPAATNTNTNLTGWGAATGTKWVYSYEVDASTQANACTADSTGSYSATSTFVSPGSPNYNLDLSGAQTATNFVPNSQVWPATNIHGTTRSGATTNAGAD